MEVQGAQVLMDLILKPENLIVVVAVWSLLSTANGMVGKLTAAWQKRWKRFLPALPILLCQMALWLPGVAHADMSIGDRVLLGCVLGFAVGHTHKIVKRTVAGK